MRKKSIFLIIVFIFALLLYQPLKAQEETLPAEPQEETKYTNESVGRVSFLEGKVFIQRAADIGYEEAVMNDPVTEGDRIGTTDGRLEIQFGRGNYLRLDRDTKLDIMSMPKRDSDLVRLRLWSGHIYLTINNLKREKTIEIHTPDSSFYILERGIYRIDVDEGRGTEILVFKGLAEAAGEQNSYLVKSEQKLEVAEGRFSSRPSSFRPVADDRFDSWNESRNQQTSRVYARRYLPEDLAEFEAELSAYGDWVYIPPYGYVWVPRNVADDWRPYYYGRWVWLPLTGWTWVPYEPWGWVAFHYGRWHWAVGIGWYWIPTYIWGPAWVSWWWDYDYFAWAPLGWYGRPVVIINNIFYDRYTGHYPLNSRALVVVRKDQLKARNIAQAALRPEALKSANLDNKINLNSTRLPFRPEGARLTVEKLDGKRVLVRQEGQNQGLRSLNPEGRSPDKPESLRPAGSPTSKKPVGDQSGEKPAVSRPQNQDKGKSVQTDKPSRTSPASGKVTPKKIKKKDESPSPQPASQYSTTLRKIPVYPSSTSASSRNTSSETNLYRSGSSSIRNYVPFSASSSLSRPTNPPRTSGFSLTRSTSSGSSRSVLSRFSGSPSRPISTSKSSSSSVARSGSVRKK